MKQIIKNISFGVVVGLMVLSSISISTIPEQISVHLDDVLVYDSITLHWMDSTGMQSSKPIASGMEISNLRSVPSTFIDTTGNLGQGNKQTTAGFCIKVNGVFRVGHKFRSDECPGQIAGYYFNGSEIEKSMTCRGNDLTSKVEKIMPV